MKKKILLIEGDHSLRRRYEKFLEWADFTVISAGDQKTLTPLLSTPPEDLDLIVFSPWSSNGTASALLESITAKIQCKRLLFLSEFQAFSPSPNGFLHYQKPMPPERLVLKVRQALETAG